MARYLPIFLAVLVLAALVTAGVRHYLFFTAQAAEVAGATDTATSVAQWMSTLRDDGGNSVFFIPAYDVKGVANGAAAGTPDPTWGTLLNVLAPVNSTREGPEGWTIHLLPNPPHAFDEWSEDALGKVYMVEWYFDSAAHAIELYRYTSRNSSDRAQGVGPIAQTIPNIAWMAAEMLLASQTPSASPYVAATLTKNHRTICANDGHVHLYDAFMQPAQPTCYPYDALEHMVGSPREIVGGNDYLVVRVQGLPANVTVPTAKIPAVGTRSTTYSSLWDQEVIAGATVPFGRRTTVYYTPPPPGNGSGWYVEPQYLHYVRTSSTSGQWEDAAGTALPGGSSVTIAQSWYTVPWTVSQQSCTDARTGGSVAPASIYGLSGYGGSPWSVAPSSTYTVPATPWSTGPFAGLDVGYGEAQPSIALVNGLANTDTVDCTMHVASAAGETATVALVIDPLSAPAASWPAEVVLGANGASVGTTTTGVIADAGRHPDLAYAINTLLGGGIAAAANAGLPCNALATTNGTTPDTSFAGVNGWTLATGVPVSGVGNITVDSGGCEVFTDGAPVPLGQAGAIAYNSSGIPETYSDQPSCQGLVSFGSLTPRSNSVDALLPTTGAAAGTCTIILTTGQSTQTTGPDSGNVAVKVLRPACVNGGHVPVGVTCQGWFGLPSSSGGYCDPQVDFALGWEGVWTASASPTGLGILADNGDGTFSYTFYSPGTVTISLSGRKAMADPGIYLCRDAAVLVGSMRFSSP